MKHDAIFRLNRIGKEFRNGNKLIFSNDNGKPIEIYKGKITFITGPNGIGKSTLIGLLGLLDRVWLIENSILHYIPADFDYTINKGWKRLFKNKPSKIRREHFSFLPQSGHLIDVMTIEENLLAGLYIKSKTNKVSAECQITLEEFKQVYRLLKNNEISDNICNLSPALLSGGGRQLLALLRAMNSNPSVIFADEPTNNMDEIVVKRTIDKLQNYIGEQKGTVVLITHDWSRMQSMLQKDKRTPYERIDLQNSNDHFPIKGYENNKNIRYIKLEKMY